MTYTIESSYSMYEEEDGKLKLMEVEDWKNFGDDLFRCLFIVLKTFYSCKVKNAK